jgi:predicted nucleic acid-binding protein
LGFRRTTSRRRSGCSAAGASSDPADTKFLHCAQAARADYLVTGNKRDFPDASYGATRVLNAGELLDRITLEI